MEVYLLANSNKDSDFSFTEKVAKEMLAKGIKVFLDPDVQNILKLGEAIEPRFYSSLDFVFVLGGDGTILRVARALKDYSPKIVGINLGRVGCLCEGKKEDYPEVIDCLLEGKYQLESRLTLEGKLLHQGKEEEIDAINEVCLLRGARLKTLNLQIKVNSTNETSFYADGLIVATPTGSSAYSLSAGGPLLIPTSNSVVITPVSPQLRTITSLVVSGEDQIEISLNPMRPQKENPHLEIDGEIAMPFVEGDRLLLKKGKSKLNIVKIHANSSLYEPIFKVANTVK